MKRRPIGLFLKGAGMGAADAVPGVSGGTIAFITGIYEELIKTIDGLDLKVITDLFKIGFQSSKTNAMEFITIATKSNSTDFGDAVNLSYSLASGASPTRGIFAGGSSPSSPYPRTNVIQKIEILTTGNAVDFGDLTFGSSHPAGLTNAHGGL